MPQVRDTSAESSGAELFPRKRWTVAECERLVNDGLIDGATYELIEGDIVSKMGQGRLHVIVMTRLVAVLSAIFGIEFVQTQAPVGIGERQENSDPEPDVAVLVNRVRDYGEVSPDPQQDVRLIVEAAASSLRGDMTVKKRLYAQAGIPEYWIVDIRGRRLIVYRRPDREISDYRETSIFSELEQFASLAAPSAAISVADLLP